VLDEPALTNITTPNSSLAVLDNPVWTALTGPHARLADELGAARRYRVDVAPFAGLPDAPSARDWTALARLAGAHADLAIAGTRVSAPTSWPVVSTIHAAQYIDAAVEPRDDESVVTLGIGDVPEMTDLVARTKPGPFLPRTVDLGGYVGIRDRGRLIAMAGHRMHPPGWIEVSAVCTDPDYRGRGLATQVVRAVVADIRRRSQRAFLHVERSNRNAIDLYMRLGFVFHQNISFLLVSVPAA